MWDVLDFKEEEEGEGVNPSDVSPISLGAPRDAPRKSLNPWIGFDHQQRPGDSCVFLQPW